MTDSDMPKCPECGALAQTFYDEGWHAACSVCPLTLGPFVLRASAIAEWVALTSPNKIEDQRKQIASLRAELVAAREELTDLRLELREATECLIKDEASLAAARAEVGRLRGAIVSVKLWLGIALGPLVDGQAKPNRKELEAVMERAYQRLGDALATPADAGEVDPPPLPPVVVVCVVDRTMHLFGDGDAWRSWSKANKFEMAWAVETTTYHARGGADGPG